VSPRPPDQRPTAAKLQTRAAIPALSISGACRRRIGRGTAARAAAQEVGAILGRSTVFTATGKICGDAQRLALLSDAEPAAR
jgi:glycerol uptake facilitator-like aquaporin